MPILRSKGNANLGLMERRSLDKCTLYFPSIEWAKVINFLFRKRNLGQDGNQWR